PDQVGVLQAVGLRDGVRRGPVLAGDDVEGLTGRHRVAGRAGATASFARQVLGDEALTGQRQPRPDEDEVGVRYAVGFSQSRDGESVLLGDRAERFARLDDVEAGRRAPATAATRGDRQLLADP